MISKKDAELKSPATHAHAKIILTLISFRPGLTIPTTRIDRTLIRRNKPKKREANKKRSDAKRKKFAEMQNQIKQLKAQNDSFKKKVVKPKAENG